MGEPLSNAFRSTALERFAPLARASESEAAESRYWTRLKLSHTQRFAAACTHAAFAPGVTRGNDGTPVVRLACSSSLNIHVLSIGKAPAPKLKGMGRFRGVAYGVSWRSDGRMLAAGDGDTGRVYAVDANTGTSLRVFDDHHHGHAKGSTCRTTAWAADGKEQRGSLLSGADSGVVALWDVATGGVKARFNAHSDSVRTVCAVNGGGADDALWCTGGYDGCVRLWDVRTSSEKAVRCFGHGAPVEAVVCVSGAMVASGGGARVALWDLLQSGGESSDGSFSTAVHSFDHAHARACSSLAVDAMRSRLISGGLDATVKVHSLRDLATVHAQRHAAPVLSVATFHDIDGNADDLLAVGLASGALEIRRKERSNAKPMRRQTLAPPKGTFRHFERGKAFTPSNEAALLIVADDDGDGGEPSARLLAKKHKLSPHDDALRGFRYGDALDLALQTREPLIVVSLLAELDRRGGLEAALQGRDEARLEPLLAFLAANVANPSFAQRLVQVANEATDLYASSLGKAPGIDELFARLSAALAVEVKAQTALARLQGSLSALVAANQAQNGND
ncbi:UTP15 C terminal-domain-containing protein [Pelagophyceae sp. CCMP2097]|nr:UTP15 C terminal-domain-containing protein [Pelagophyceae sp. CCMP2097]